MWTVCVLAACKTPRPPFLEAVLLEKAKDAYMPALVDWMNARSALDEAENDMLRRNSDDLTRRLQAEAKHTAVDSPELTAKSNELIIVCADVVQLRTDLAGRDGGAAHEIDLLRQETRNLRKIFSLGPETLRSRYNAETSRLSAEANNLPAFVKRVASDLATAKAERDRLKAVATKR